MSTAEKSVPIDMWAQYGDHYIAVNEDGQLRSKPPIRPLAVPYNETYERPINAGIARKHLVFFIHGGLNDLATVTARIQDYQAVFDAEPWHLIHLAWDTSLGSSIDDVVQSFRTWRSWQNLLRLAGSALPWKWFGRQRSLHRPAAYFGSIAWKSQYDTALAATGLTRMTNDPQDRGFHRAFQHLNDSVREGDDVGISFVVHSAGSVVANYLLELLETNFPRLKERVRRYILLAPSCHVTQFERTLATANPARPTVCLTLTAAQELADSIGIYDRSLLWAIHDLFEANWDPGDYERFRIPTGADRPHTDLHTTALLGLAQQLSDLENRPSDPFDRTLGGRVQWAASGEERSIDGLAPRVWTESATHGGFSSDPTTRESLKLLLA